MTLETYLAAIQERADRFKGPCYHCDRDVEREPCTCFDKLEARQELYDGDALPKLIAALRVAVSGLDTALYDLERVRDANWDEHQMRLGAQSGAHIAKKALAQIEKILGDG